MMRKGNFPMTRLIRLAYSLVVVVLLSAALFAPTQSESKAATHEVTSLADSGLGTLRQAMIDAQAGDTITFSVSVFPPNTPATIMILSPLPTLTQNNLTLDASNAGVVLDGSLSPAGTNGLIVEADNCVIQGLTIQYFKSNGIFVGADSSGNLIGGNRTIGSGPHGQGNLISNNGGTGVEIRGAGVVSNTVQGNYIGIDATGWWTGTNAYNGVALTQGAQGNTIGGATASLGNIISGNHDNGIWGSDADTSGNIIIGN
jgi:hypothetical protein